MLRESSGDGGVLVAVLVAVGFGTSGGCGSLVDASLVELGGAVDCGSVVEVDAAVGCGSLVDTSLVDASLVRDSVVGSDPGTTSTSWIDPAVGDSGAEVAVAAGSTGEAFVSGEANVPGIGVAVAVGTGTASAAVVGTTWALSGVDVAIG